MIGIDLGGTKTEGVVMTPAGDILVRRRIETPVRFGYDAVIKAVRALAIELETAAGCRCTVGVCTPGSISARTGMMKNSNTRCLNGRDFKHDLQTALGRPLRIENDANCFTLSEAFDGAAKNYSVVFGVIMGTGVGGGLAIDKRLLPGRHHIAGEWGHNVLEPDGPECYCGRHGCVEVFLSGPGLLRSWPEPHRRPGSVLALLALAQSGDTRASAVMDRFYARFGAALAMVINILDPDVVVLGGGMSNIEPLYTKGVEALKRHVFNDQVGTPVLANRHGDSSGVRGAARLWGTSGTV